MATLKAAIESLEIAYAGPIRGDLFVLHRSQQVGVQLFS